jgi:hypothetical protein
VTKLESDVDAIRFQGWLIAFCLVVIVLHIIVFDVWFYMMIDTIIHTLDSGVGGGDF